MHKGLCHISDISFLHQKVKPKKVFFFFFLCGNAKFQLSIFISKNSLPPSGYGGVGLDKKAVLGESVEYLSKDSLFQRVHSSCQATGID